MGMIFSGLIMIQFMKRGHGNSSQNVWLAYFPIKFALTLTITPFGVIYYYTSKSLFYQDRIFMTLFGFNTINADSNDSN